MMFANFLNVFFLLLSRRPFYSILAELGLQRDPFGSPLSQILQILHEKKRGGIGAQKLMTLGRLLEGAGGSGEACLSLQTLREW